MLAELGALAVAHLGEASAVTVHRTAAGTRVNGTWVKGAVTDSDLDAVVYHSTPRDLLQLPEGERGNEAITILSEFAFRTSDVSGQYEADRVTWQGRVYRVTTVGDWLRVGGFTSVIAVRCEA